MSVSIHEATSRAEREAFLDFPLRLYAGDAAFVPPAREWVRRRLDPKNPFFREASLRLFVARRGGEIVGTISALRDTRWERLKGERVGFFGFFEVADDPEAAAALIGAAEGAARGWGAEILRGPRNLTRVEEVGVTVEGHDKAPPMLASHHGPWVAPILEGLGFEKHHDVLAYDVLLHDADGRPRQLPAGLRAKSEALDLPGLEVRRARWRRINADLTDAHAVFTEAFKSVPDTTPMPRAQFVNLGRAFLAFANTRMLQLAYVEGRPVAFAVCLPELNEAIREARGHLLPLGWARMLWGVRHIRTASFKLIGVLPEYRKSGIHARLITHVVEALRAQGYARLEASLIDERNGPMRAVVEGAGMSIYRRYRIYERPIR